MSAEIYDIHEYFRGLTIGQQTFEFLGVTDATTRYTKIKTIRRAQRCRHNHMRKKATTITHTLRQRINHEKTNKNLYIFVE